MVRTYKRKREVGYTVEDIHRALNAVKNGCSIRQAARDYDLAEATVRRHFHANERITSNPTSFGGIEIKKPGHPTVGSKSNILENIL